MREQGLWFIRSSNQTICSLLVFIIENRFSISLPIVLCLLMFHNFPIYRSMSILVDYRVYRCDIYSKKIFLDMFC